MKRQLLAVTAVTVLAAAMIPSATIRAVEGEYQLVDNWARFPPGMSHWGVMPALSIDSRGTIYAFQRGDPSLVILFDAVGRFLKSWGEGMFPDAHGLRVDRENFIWVTDRGLHQVLKFTSDGKLVMALGKKGVAGDNDSHDAFNAPSDVLVVENGDIFVADGESTNSRIVKFSPKGKFIKFWGSRGSALGQFDVPHCIVTDSKGRLYVSDRRNNRVQIFDQGGKYLSQMTEFGTPSGMYMTKDDVLYVIDDVGKRVTIAKSSNGKVLGRIGGLENPHWVAVDASGSVYVAETRGSTLREIKKFIKK